ncbi:hypothetical protein [Oceanobacter mangrovi]|uniref:hypothetical protein n=1 Tax=Oceanobacter mangrovi TaxID=2862510 RepID=UPI001C8E4460|nr:hypothetical protein [Oceanobacter mangrovi]
MTELPLDMTRPARLVFADIADAMSAQLKRGEQPVVVLPFMGGGLEIRPIFPGDTVITKHFTVNTKTGEVQP